MVAVSTLEHIGLGRYGDKVDYDGDILAVQEISRILSKNGAFLFTVPFGKGETYPNHRVYDDQGLNRLLNSFMIERTDYFVRNSEGFWEPCLRNKLANTRFPVVEMGLACVKAKKI